VLVSVPETTLQVAHRWSGEVWASLDGPSYIGAELAPECFIAAGIDVVGMTFGKMPITPGIVPSTARGSRRMERFSRDQGCIPPNRLIMDEPAQT
jgi:hypothetical protein